MTFFSLGVIACVAITAGARENLKTPFSFPARGLSDDIDFSCKPLPVKPVKDLFFHSVYDQNDPSRSKVDPDARKRYLEAVRPIRNFEKKLIYLANNYLRSSGNEAGYAVCALGWLHEWAKEDAMLGNNNMLGGIVRHWTLASLASAYAQIKSEKELDETARKDVERWLQEIARKVIKTYPADPAVGSKKNNHLYWAAWSVTVTGTAIDDRDLYNWGIDRARYAIKDQLHGDGTLPLELGRGSKAFHYHVFAAAPLVMIAETGLRNGDNLYEVRDGLLHRLVKRIIYEMDEPGYFEKKTGTEQIGVNEISNVHFAWLEVYNSRFPRKDAKRWLKKFRPLFQRRTGGNMTLLFHTINN